MNSVKPAVSYFHVDVFTGQPFSGNSLAVFADATGLDSEQMLAITQEMRHFESIFLTPTDKPAVFEARVFDLFEELDFAGHPLIGAGAVLHRLYGTASEHHWTFRLPKKTVTLDSFATPNGYRCVLDQGQPQFIAELSGAVVDQVAQSLNLAPEQLDSSLPLAVVSTGLPYLIVPVKGALAEARIVSPDFEALLHGLGAQFAYLLDADALEGRHWNNDGVLEDVATGSAAGTVGAYLAKQGLVALNQTFSLQQGRFMGRSSQIEVQPVGEGGAIETVRVGGEVAFVAQAELLNQPRSNQQ